MDYPSQFFYEESGSLIRYQQEATANLSVDRLLKGHNAYWVSPLLHQNKKKKITSRG